ncbi:MAG: hypothetical protein RJB54_749 [Actinomycetota bacterium]
MKNLGNHSYSKQSAKNISGVLVEVVLKNDGTRGAKSLELLDAGSSNCGSNSRVAARAFAGADHATISNPHSFNFIGMNAATVVATGSLSSKGVNFVAGNRMNDVHGKSSINFLHLMPSNFEALQGIDNQQSFIKENNFGMNENNVKNVADHQAPRDGARSVSESVINNVDVNQSANSKECAESHDVTTSWSKGLQIRHLAIISRNEIEIERRAA